MRKPDLSFARPKTMRLQGILEWERNQKPGVLAVHTTFVSGRGAKKHYMRERDLWKARIPPIPPTPLPPRSTKLHSGL